MSCRQRTIGCWFSAKKKKKVNIEKLRSLVANHGAQLIEIEITRRLETQGPFDAILHKMTDRMIEAMDGNEDAQRDMEGVETYLRNHPNTIVVDPLHSIRKLLDRFETYKLIHSTKICRSGKLHIPTFIQINSKDESSILQQMHKHNVNFPFVCKKSVSHGSASHKMSIIFNKEGLKDVDPPCVAQTFINHGALLYKIYVIADKYHVVKRPSLRNFSKQALKDHQTIFFNSHDISSGESSRSNLTTPDEDDAAPAPELDRSLVNMLTNELHSELEMTMYGVDIIVSTETGKHYVIDVNVFPGYDGVPSFLETLVDHIMRRLDGCPNGNSLAKNHQKMSGENRTLSATKNGLPEKNAMANDQILLPASDVVLNGEPKSKLARHGGQLENAANVAS